MHIVIFMKIRSVKSSTLIDVLMYGVMIRYIEMM